MDKRLDPRRNKRQPHCHLLRARGVLVKPRGTSNAIGCVCKGSNQGGQGRHVGNGQPVSSVRVWHERLVPVSRDQGRLNDVVGAVTNAWREHAPGEFQTDRCRIA